MFVIDSTSTDCTPETKLYAYLMDTNNTLYRFNPTTFDIVEIGLLNCSTSSNLSSIAVQRNRILQATLEDGTLFKYNIRAAVCSSTTFVANQSNITQFTMTFVKSSNDTCESLYVSQQTDSNISLVKIDLTTLTLSVVGEYNALSTYAEITRTNDGRLFGVFDATPYTIAQIDVKNAQILSQYPLNRSSENDNSNYGFTVYNTRFFFFEGNGSYSDLFSCLGTS
jgi:hypothetical protein